MFALSVNLSAIIKIIQGYRGEDLGKWEWHHPYWSTPNPLLDQFVGLGNGKWDWGKKVERAWKNIVLGYPLWIGVKGWGTEPDKKRAGKLLMYPFPTSYTSPTCFSGSPLCTPPSPTTCQNFCFQEMICRRILKLCCYLLFGKWNACRLIVIMDLLAREKLASRFCLREMLSQHNACQNCLSLMKSNICLWAALKTANYFLPFEVPDRVKIFFLFCCMLIKCLGWMMGF